MHGAARKEHGAAAVFAADARLLAKVRCDPRHNGQGTHTAKALSDMLSAERVAFSGTKIT